MKKEKFFTIRNITLIGVLAACVFVLTKFASIPIPTPLGKTALSVGNTMCILGSVLFGPLVGGLSAGIGNALVDLTDPVWAREFIITFINKFLMAFVAGIMMRYFRVVGDKVRVWIAGAAGSITYVILHITKNIISGVKLQGFTLPVAIAETLTLKLPVSLANAALAVICASLLYLALKEPLRRAHIIS